MLLDTWQKCIVNGLVSHNSSQLSGTNKCACLANVVAEGIYHERLDLNPLMRMKINPILAFQFLSL
jgi:hypothetical protein